MNAQELLDKFNQLKSNGVDLSEIELGFSVENDNHKIDGMFLHNTSEIKWIEFYHEII
jgi:hypothetical protein